MIELIISEFATITLTFFRGVSRNSATTKMELYVILVYGF